MCALKISNDDNNLDSVSGGSRGGSGAGFTQVKIKKDGQDVKNNNGIIGSHTISISGNKTKR